MSDDSPLVVPITVEALVVNDAVRVNGGFFRADMLYSNLSGGGSVLPSATNGGDPNFDLPGDDVVQAPDVTAAQYYDGVYLKWRLPAALTRGHLDNRSGVTRFPLVPNRWLVVRFGGALTARTATAWIVESDYLGPGNDASATTASLRGTIYVQEDAGAPTAVYMGRNVPLGTWSESGHSLGLTAMGPGNPVFAVYQPQNNNVFSLIDILDGEPDQTLSYLVTGWYSDPADDPLAGAADFVHELKRRHWKLPDGTAAGTTATWSVYSGVTTGVAWSATATPPGGAPPVDGTSIAVGNTSAEALTALIAAQAAAAGADVEPELLEALQLDAIELLDRPDGAALLAERLHTRAFQRVNGGYQWDVVPAPQASDRPASHEVPSWLPALQAAQAALDAAVVELAAMQRDLFVWWWKLTSWPGARAGAPAHRFASEKPFREQLDPHHPGSAAAAVKAQLATVAELAAQVPSGDTPEALERAIAAYAAAHGLPAGQELKRSAAPAFFLPNDPVVLIAGGGASGIARAPAEVQVRFASQLLGGFDYDGQSITSAVVAVPAPDLSGVSGVPWSAALATALIGELFFVDPDNAQMIATAIGSTDVSGIAAAMGQAANVLPAGAAFPLDAVTTWTGNPWHPVSLVWAALYVPIDHGSAGAPNWTYADGAYTWNGVQTTPLTEIAVQGLVQLAPTASVNLDSRIRHYLEQHPHLPHGQREALRALRTFIADADAWDLLSQSLDGWNPQLQLGLPGAFAAPTGEAARLIGTASTYPPGLGTLPSEGDPPAPSLFQPWRAGQFQFTYLAIVDEWGQMVRPIDQTTENTERIYVAPSMAATQLSTAATLAVSDGLGVAALVPPNASAGGAALTLTVVGAGFTSDAAVAWNGAALATTFVDDSHLQAAVTADLIAAAGTASVTVSGSAALDFTIAAGPAIASLSPSVVTAGTATSDTVALTLTGSGFGDDTVVHAGKRALATTVVNGGLVLARLPARQVVEPGELAITASSGGVASAAVALTIAAGAAIADLDPPMVTAGAAAFTLTVTGSGFTPASVVTVGGSALVTTFVGDTQLTASVTADLVASAGSAAVEVEVGHPVVSTDATLIQLGPALLQPARVAFELISAADHVTRLRGVHPADSPIAGWVLPSHLDGSLALYDRAGHALGSLAVGLPTTGAATVSFTPVPGARYHTLAALAAHVPQLGPFAEALVAAGPTAFTAFMAAIDETLWTTAPMGAHFDRSLAALMGRPLALVCARVQLELAGAAVADPSWRYTFKPAKPVLPTYQFAVELGDGGRLDDGLIGYFVDGDYTLFHAVAASDAASSGYLHTIGVDGDYLYLPFDGSTAATVTMLVDPRAPVHATTAILPIAKVTVPGRQVDAALAAMDLYVQVKGILTDERRAHDHAQPSAVAIPVPRRAGTWTWLDREDDAWVEHAVVAPSTSALLGPVMPRLRRGVLRLSPKDRR